MADVFDHITIRVSDVDASLRFYALAFAQLDYDEPHRGVGFLRVERLLDLGGRDGGSRSRAAFTSRWSRNHARRSTSGGGEQ